MKILYVGYHNPSFINSTVYREEAIKSLGHEVISFDDRAYVLPGRLREKFSALKKWDIRRLNSNLLKTALKESPEACFVVGGHGILSETVDRLRGIGVKTVLWTADPPVRYDLPTAVPRDFGNIVKAAPGYDHVFCAGSEAVEILEQHGVKAVWLPFACDPKYQHPIDLTEKDRRRYQRDIVFVGSYYSNREKIFEGLADMDIRIWGPSWSRLREGSPLKGKVLDSRVGYQEWVKIYNAAKIVVVVNFDDGETLSHQASPKLYEALACKSFVLVDNKPDARAVFQDGEDVVFFSGFADLREKIVKYLNCADERARISENGYRKVLDKHTYEDRIKMIIKTLEE